MIRVMAVVQRSVVRRLTIFAKTNISCYQTFSCFVVNCFTNMSEIAIIPTVYNSITLFDLGNYQNALSEGYKKLGAFKLISYVIY